MADTFDLADDLGDAARSASDLRREMIDLIEEEGRAILRRKDLAALEERRGKVEESRLRNLKDEAAALDAVARGFRTAQAGIAGFSQVFQSFARADVLGGAQGVFGMVSRLGSRWQGQADEAAKARGEKGGTSVAGSALGAIGAAGQTVVQAFSAVAGGAMTLFGTLRGFATQAAPGLGRVFGDIWNLLSAKIGERFVPALIEFAANVLTWSDKIAEAVGEVLAACMEFGKWVMGWVSFTTGTVSDEMKKAGGKMAAYGPDTEEGGGPFGGSVAEQARRMARRLGNGPAGEDEEEKAREKTKRDNMAKVLRAVIQGGGGMPQIEQGADQTWRRLQMAELGQNDVQREQLDVQRRVLDFLQTKLAEMADQGGNPEAGSGKNWLSGVFGF